MPYSRSTTLRPLTIRTCIVGLLRVYGTFRQTWNLSQGSPATRAIR